MFGGLFGALGGGFFDANFRAYPVAFIEKESAEAGDKVILPPSSLNTLASMHVEYPMLFKVENKRGQRMSHCGVLEFIAQEGMVYMPQWMMDNLLLSVGDLVNLKNVSLPKGSFIKIQPHTTNFLDIANPKAVLETCLRNFTCLTEGDTIVIPYNGENYYIDIQEVKPDRAVSVVETDVEVDFAPPKDYKEPDYKPAPAAVAPALPTGGSSTGAASASGSAKAAEAEPEPPRFTAFAGSGNRIDGKASGSGSSAFGSASASARTTMDSQAAPSSGGPSTGGGLKAGKVVFGDSSENGAAPAVPGIPGNRLATRLANKQSVDGKPPTAPPPKKEEEKEEKPKFAAFGGKGRNLKD